MPIKVAFRRFNMKKIIALASSAILLCASFVSCGSNEKMLTYRYNYDLSEYIELSDYKGIPAEAYKVNVTDEDIDRQVLATRSYYSKLHDVTDRGAQFADTVYIDYVGTIDGEEFEGGSDNDCELTLGTGTFFEGFEESILGVRAGETVSVDLTFPDPYLEYPTLAGKTAHFEIKVNTVSEQELPELNEDFVRGYLGFDSLDEYKENVRKTIENYRENLSAEYVKTQTWDYILENTKVIKYPDEEYNYAYSSFVDYIKAKAASSGVTYEAYVEVFFDMTTEEFELGATELAEQGVKEDMICYAIARSENLTIDDKEYKERATAYAKENFDMDFEEFEKTYSKETILEQLMIEKVKDFVAENADITYVEE